MYQYCLAHPDKHISIQGHWIENVICVIFKSKHAVFLYIIYLILYIILDIFFQIKQMTTHIFILQN